MTAPGDSDAAWNPLWSGPRAGPDWIAFCNDHPVALFLNLVTLAAGENEMSFSLDGVPAPNPNGSVHGGLLAAALDHVLATTAMLGMDDDGQPNTAGLNIQFVRPAMPPLEIDSRVTRAGKSLVFTRAEVRNRNGHICATADGTFAVVTLSHVTARS